MKSFSRFEREFQSSNKLSQLFALEAGYKDILSEELIFCFLRSKDGKIGNAYAEIPGYTGWIARKPNW